jgi:hypothetical protein
MRFVVTAIPAAELDRIRFRGVDDLGNELRPQRADGDEPLRCCLRAAIERLLSRPDVARIDGRSVTYGCYQFRIEPAA